MNQREAKQVMSYYLVDYYNQGGLNSKIHLAVDGHRMPINAIITSGTTADCMQVWQIGDTHTNALIALARAREIEPVI